MSTNIAFYIQHCVVMVKNFPYKGGVPMVHRHRALDSTLVSSIFKTGSSLKRRNSLGVDFTALTHLCFSVALSMYILALISTCCQLCFLRSNWQNSQRFFLESFRPLNHIKNKMALISQQLAYTLSKFFLNSLNSTILQYKIF